MTERRTPEDEVDRFLGSLAAANPPPGLAAETVELLHATSRSTFSLQSRWRSLVAVGAAVMAIVLVVALGPALAPPSAPATSVNVPTAATGVLATPLPSATPAASGPPVASGHPPVPQFEYVRFLADRVPIRSDIEAGETVGQTQVGEVVPVLARTTIADVNWIRVQLMDGWPINGWVPERADVLQSGQLTRDVYESATLTCPETPTTADELAVMVPAHALACFSSQTLTLSPVQIEPGSGDWWWVQGDPDWLGVWRGLLLTDAGDQAGDPIFVHMDPALGVDLPPDTWLEIEGMLDHPAAASCTRSSERAIFRLASQDEATLWCRERFVITAARVLPEQPPTPEPPRTPGPPATRTISFTTPDVVPPITPRFGASTVWTGGEVIVWGGTEEVGSPERLRSDGAAYDPDTDEWRIIADGPLDERMRHLGAWTGTEMIIWGGSAANYIEPANGAAYDPRTDRWREIAAGPLAWGNNANSVWTGSELVILSTDRDDVTRVAAYDPAADSWRSFPQLPEGGQPIWTGEELIVTTGSGIYRLRSDGGWESPDPHGYGVHGPAVWTGEDVVGLHWDVDWVSLVAWDPTTGAWRDLPPPPHSLSGSNLVWADGRLILDGGGLAFDLGSEQWWNLGNASGRPRTGSDVVWIGDRLFVMGGGESGGHTQPVPFPTGYMLIPEW